MAENLQKRPPKGILKNSSSFDKPTSHCSPSQAKKAKETKWDEMNIIATYHPPDKDYGHMKVDEPKTPFSYDINDQSGVDGLDATELAEKIRIAASQQPTVMTIPDEEESSSSDDEQITEEAKLKRKDFLEKRKQHYNEGQALQLAKQLLEEDDEEDDAGSSKK
ncbi:unnamed protein product [Brassicogethes aeneus]|uniref:Protein phosphatase inhibitor 2 n=1 Tax=Brassicogethes aeneus TaxID=1431903 RepID=A0A9P0ATB6_BRAAE|nr:unnamed protein product [Brassicogethes aeneus]